MNGAAPTVTTEIGLSIPIQDALPNPWKGGVHSGVRLTPEQRNQVMELLAENLSDSEISKRLGHSRNTIAALAADPARAAWLKEHRAARLLAAEDSLLRSRTELIGELEDTGKLKVADLNSALMITGIGIKDAGGSAPQRLEVTVEHEFSVAAQLMAGGQDRQPVSFAPSPDIIEAELVPILTKENDPNAGDNRPNQKGL